MHRARSKRSWRVRSSSGSRDCATSRFLAATCSPRRTRPPKAAARRRLPRRRSSRQSPLRPCSGRHVWSRRTSRRRQRRRPQPWRNRQRRSTRSLPRRPQPSRHRLRHRLPRRSRNRRRRSRMCRSRDRCPRPDPSSSRCTFLKSSSHHRKLSLHRLLRNPSRCRCLWPPHLSHTRQPRQSGRGQWGLRHRHRRPAGSCRRRCVYASSNRVRCLSPRVRLRPQSGRK